MFFSFARTTRSGNNSGITAKNSGDNSGSVAKARLQAQQRSTGAPT
jgi:hypothetical protein